MTPDSSSKNVNVKAAQRKVLALDGGGIKGTFPAAFLAAVEENVEGRVADYFDLIVGTSTGGIIALGLGLGWSASDLLSFYEEYGPRIFRKASLWECIRWLRRSKYDPAPLHQALQERFGERKIGESSVRLVVPSINLETGAVYLYKTAHHPRFERDYKKCAVEAARATSAAPTYFPSFISDSGVPLVDGGLWANNPAAVAAVEARTILEWRQGDVAMLSIGCTREPFDGVQAQRRSKGLVYWGLQRKAIDLFMTAQSSSANGMAQHLLGKEHVLRINPTLPRRRFSLDDASGIRALKGLGESEARYALPALRKRFFASPAAPFVPCHSPESSAKCA